jgi:hypothetical protein
VLDPLHEEGLQATSLAREDVSVTVSLEKKRPQR